MTNEQYLLKQFFDDHYNPDTQNLEIDESEESHLIELIANTLPENQQDEFVIENEYTRYWNMLNNCNFDSNYHKDELFKNLFEQKINDYKISLAMNYIQHKLNLSPQEYNDLTDELTNEATKLALDNDKKNVQLLQDNLNNYLIDNFKQIFGFDPSDAGTF